MTTATDDKELLAGLTEEERAMLAEDDGDTGTEGSDNAENDAGGNEDDGAAGAAGDTGDADAGAAAGRDDGAGDDAGAGEPEGSTVQSAPNAPLLVAEAPADAEAKLKEIAESKADLRKKYDDGDLTFEEYENEKDKLDEQRLEIRQAINKAEIAAQMAQQQARNEFLSYAQKFTSDIHPEYAKDEALYKALDAQVIELANIPKYAGLTGPEILEKAHKLILIDHPDKFAKSEPEPKTDAGKKQAKQEVKLPPNLAKVPAADMNDTGEGRFAHLDRLAERGGMAFEQALAALSEAERNAYLAQ